MVGISFDIEGIDKAINRMDMSVRKVNDEANNALRMGGNVARGFLEINTPVRTGQAKNDVQMSGVRTATSIGEKSILIGYGRASYWYMKFVNDGTYSKGNPKGIRPRKHVERSFQASAGSIEKVMAHYMADIIASV